MPVSPHRFDVSNRRNGVVTVTRVASNVFLEPKALQLLDIDVDLFAVDRQRFEAPGGDPEVDGERQAAVLFADLVVDHPYGLMPVADNRFDPKADIPRSATREEWFAITRRIIQDTIADMNFDPATEAAVIHAFTGAGLL